MPFLSAKNAVFFPILEFSARDIAEQLTIVDAEISSHVEPEEFTVRLWADPGQYALAVICKCLVKSVERFNLVSFWVASVICTESSLPARVRVLEHIIDIGKVYYLRSTGAVPFLSFRKIEKKKKKR